MAPLLSFFLSGRTLIFFFFWLTRRLQRVSPPTVLVAGFAFFLLFPSPSPFFHSAILSWSSLPGNNWLYPSPCRRFLNQDEIPLSRSALPNQCTAFLFSSPSSRFLRQNFFFLPQYDKNGVDSTCLIPLSKYTQPGVRVAFLEPLPPPPLSRCVDFFSPFLSFPLRSISLCFPFLLSRIKGESALL